MHERMSCVVDYNDIKDISRILIEADLQPVQGDRFQPTGFPDLGAATYRIPTTGSNALLVESAQSMANRLEAVCLDSSQKSLVEILKGIPFVTVKGPDDKVLTNSVLEAHRLSSAYILEGKDQKIMNKIKEAVGIKEKDQEADLEMFSKLHQFLFETDTNSLLHGIFFAKSELAGGRLKIPRALSAFIEATETDEVLSGGAKIDIVNPSTEEGSDASTGFGNIPFSRMEYSAKKITAYFNIDVSQIVKYSIKDDDAKVLLLVLALWKIRKFLDSGLRLRTACDFEQKGELRIVKPSNFTIPPIDDLEEQIKKLIDKFKNEFESLDITYKKSNKKKK